MVKSCRSLSIPEPRPVGRSLRGSELLFPLHCQGAREFPLACLAQHVAQLPDTLGVEGHAHAVLGLVEFEFNLPDAVGQRLRRLHLGTTVNALGGRWETEVNAKEFFQEIVTKNYQESTADKASLRKLWNAVVSMNTVAEYVALAHLGYADDLERKDIDAKSSEVRKQYPNLQSLKKLAETLKHVRRHIPSGQLTASSTGIAPMDPTTWVWRDGSTLYNLRDALDRAFKDCITILS